MYTTYIKSIYAQTFAEDAALLVRLPLMGGNSICKVSVGYSQLLLREYILRVTQQNIFTLLQQPRMPLHTVTLLHQQRLMYIYNMGEVNICLYNVYMFFFNAGMLRGTFLTLAHTRCGYDAMALNYFVYNQGLLKPTLNPADLLPHRTTHIQQAAAALKYGVDFVFVVDGTLSEGDLQTILATQLPIVGIGATPRMLLFYDIYIPLYAGTPVLQHYFLEYALYAYISGRRYSIRQQHEMICALYNSLLS